MEDKKPNLMSHFVVTISEFLNRILLIPFRYFVERHAITKQSKTAVNYTYLTITNKSGLRMLRYSLASILQSAETIPKKVVIVSDGSWENWEANSYFDFWPGEIEFESWEVSANYHLEKERHSLYIYASKQIWGKKLSAILKYAEIGHTIYSDTDVLWFKSPFSGINTKEETGLRLTIDNSYNYDLNLLAGLDREDMLNKPPLNCGIVYAKGDFFKKSVLLQKAIDLESLSPGPFSEQTILALLTDEFGTTWDFESVTSKIDDGIFPIIPDYKKQYNHFIARHYVWAMKWLFWRDFLYLRKKN